LDVSFLLPLEVLLQVVVVTLLGFLISTVGCWLLLPVRGKLADRRLLVTATSSSILEAKIIASNRRHRPKRFLFVEWIARALTSTLPCRFMALWATEPFSYLLFVGIVSLLVNVDHLLVLMLSLEN